jgi:hypothetical protein
MAMVQLDLFGAPVPPPPPPPPPEPEPAPPEIPDVLPGQVGLFDPRTMLLGRARAAVAAGDLDAAYRDLAAVTARSPSDAQLAEEAREILALRERLARVDAPRTRNRAEKLLAVANDLGHALEPLASLRRRILARVAAEVRAQHGDAGELRGRLAGEYLLDAGEVAEARSSFAAAFAATGDPRALFRLGDAALLLGDQATARRAYLHALLTDPFHPARAGVRDEEVRSLPEAVRDEAEIEDDPEAWAAPAGIVLGVLPRVVAGDRATLPPIAGALSPARRDALSRARAFVEALTDASAARGEAAVAVRRTMKQLSPRLFALYMDRVVRGRAG